jgi:hypothetical protein
MVSLAARHQCPGSPRQRVYRCQLLGDDGLPACATSSSAAARSTTWGLTRLGAAPLLSYRIDGVPRGSKPMPRAPRQRVYRCQVTAMTGLRGRATSSPRGPLLDSMARTSGWKPPGIGQWPLGAPLDWISIDAGSSSTHHQEGMASMVSLPRPSSCRFPPRGQLSTSVTCLVEGGADGGAGGAQERRHGPRT